jgi:hypothetical protein
MVCRLGRRSSERKDSRDHPYPLVSDRLDADLAQTIIRSQALRLTRVHAIARPIGGLQREEVESLTGKRPESWLRLLIFFFRC